MPSKGTKKQRRTAAKTKSQAPGQIVDDGTRWTVVDAKTDRPIYNGQKGTQKQEAERLSYSLVADTKVVQIK